MDRSNEKLLAEARKRYARGVEAEQCNRDEALDDLRMLAAQDRDQWPEDIVRDREASGRLVLQINMLPKYVAQVAGDMRINRTAIKVSPVDDGADPKLAEVMAGIVRNVERNSMAVHVYSEAGTQAASCGMGFFRVTTEYADDDVFDLDLRIRSIRNPFAVVFDPGAVEYDRSDARWCFVVDEMTREEFKATYPEADPKSWDSISAAELTHWLSEDMVRVAEYWERKETRETVCRLPTGEVVRESALKAMAPELLAQVTARREVVTHEVNSYLLTGGAILKGPTRWPGKHIPIVPVWGRQVQVGERLIRKSVIRDAKDPQRLYNYYRTAAAESIALAPKSPWLATSDMVKGYESMWANANIENRSVLLYNHDRQSPGGAPQRVSPPAPPTALFQETQFAEGDMHGTTGIYPAALGARSNETSGKAILARQREADVGTVDFIDNLARSVTHCGRILLDLIPKVYDGERMMRILGEDDAIQFVTLNRVNPRYGVDAEAPEYVTVLKDDKGRTHVLPDLSAGKYDVTVSTGPSFSTRREESRENMMAFLQAFPDAAGAAGDLFVKAQDWPGSDEMAKRLRRLAVAQGVADPDPEDEASQPKPPPPPDPKMIADAKAKEADAAYKTAQAQGVTLDNMSKEIALSIQTGQFQAMIGQLVEQRLMQILGSPGMPPGIPAQPGPMQPAPDPGGGLFNAPQQPMATPQMGVYPEQLPQ